MADQENKVMDEVPVEVELEASEMPITEPEVSGYVEDSKGVKFGAKSVATAHVDAEAEEPPETSDSITPDGVQKIIREIIREVPVEKIVYKDREVIKYKDRPVEVEKRINVPVPVERQWEADVDYKLGDCVQMNGKWYVCVAAHHSTDACAPNRRNQEVWLNAAKLATQIAESREKARVWDIHRQEEKG